MEVKVIKKEQGLAIDIIEENGFKIHGLMFTNRELLQCLFLSSRSCYESIMSQEINAMMITINRKEKNIICAPMMYNKAFSRKLKKVDEDVKVNTYIRDTNNSTVFLLSIGFIIDNFEVRPSYHDFLLSEEQPFVFIEAQDIESLTVKNPLLV